MKRKGKIIIFLAVIGALLLMPQPGSSQQDQKPKDHKQTEVEKKGETVSTTKIKLDDVVVTATRTEKIVQDVPVHASVVTREEIQEQNIKSIDEAINYLEGIYNKRAKGFMDSTQKMSLRGFPGSNRVLVLLDNQPLNTGYTGEVPWEIIPIDSVERIEVIRGPSSALHGGNAMGGVVNIITHTPKKLEVWAEYGYGTYNTHIEKIHLGNEWANRFSLFATYEKQKTDGYHTSLITKSSTSTKPGGTVIPVTGVREGQDEYGKTVYSIGDVGENGWDADSLHLKFGFRPNALAKVALGYTYNENEYFYEGQRSGLFDPNGVPVFNGNIEFINKEGKTEYITSLKEYNFLGGPGVEKHNVFTLSYDHQLIDTLHLSLRGGLTDEFENWYITPQSGATAGGGSGKISDTPSTTTTAEVQSDWSGFQNQVLTLGISNRREEAENTEYSLTNWRDEKSREEKLYLAEGKVNSWALFFQEEWQATEKIALFAGGRWDNWQAEDGRSSRYIDANTMEIISFSERKDHYLSPKF